MSTEASLEMSYNTGFDSRIVNDPSASKAYADHAKKCGQPLLTTENEIVVFKDEATVPKYLIVFDSTIVTP